MLPAPSSTGVDTVAGPPVGVVVQQLAGQIRKFAPSNFTECTVAFRLKMIWSGDPTLAETQLSGHGMPLIAPVPLLGVCVATVPSLTLIAFSVPAFVPT